MKPAAILFEKIIQDGSISNDTLISASEKRRSFMRVKQLGRNARLEAKDYYASFDELLELMEANSQDCFEAAKETTDLKEKKRILEDAIRFGTLALATLSMYGYEDVSLRYLPIFQDRYLIHLLFRGASSYYKTMNDFAVKQGGQMNKTCIKRAYMYADAAYNVWNRDGAAALHELKSLYLLQLA